MKIIVCMKQVLDTRVPLEVNDSVKQKESSPIYIMNPADRVALTKALEIKDTSKGSEVTAITAGPKRAEQMLRLALASGVDRAVYLRDEIFESSDAYITALALSSVIKELEYDVILCGNRSLDTNAGQVPAFLAESLGIPQVSGVMSLEVISPQRVRLWRRLEKGRRQIVECPLPALYAVDSSAGQPRYVSEFALIRSRQREIQNISLSDIGLAQSDVAPRKSLIQVTGLSHPKPRPKKIFIPGGDVPASQRMSYLLSGGVAKGKESNLLEGDAEYLSRQILEYLKEEGIISEQSTSSETGG